MRLVAALAVACAGWAQEPAPQDPPVLFRERVNLVTVPVVVRDRQGRSVGSLTREDFQILDRGKAQAISRFAVEKSTKAGAAVESGGEVKPASALARSAVPERFIAYLFDDLHAEFGDLARSRDAAWKHIQSSLGEGDRAAIYTTSGQTIQDFTDDQEKLEATLLKLSPRPRFSRSYYECPDLSHYQADLIINRADTWAFNVAVAETMKCAQVDRRVAEGIARGAASRVFSMANQSSRIALYTLRDVVKRMAAAPGQRVILLASPGFVASQENFERNDIIDRAIKANVIINGLDARGLWVDSLFDASRPALNPGDTQKNQIEREAQRVSSDIVADLAEGTGGQFFHNSNDLTGGFRKLAETPEHVYMLGFSPENLKLDGSFHSLKVTVRTEEKLSAKARRGYYAPKQTVDAKEAAQEEIRAAVFSKQEQREIPAELSVTSGRSPEGSPQLMLALRIPLSGLRFKDAGDRGTNLVTLAQAIFDHNGNYVTGEESTIDLNVKKETLASPTAMINARKAYDLKPGVYAVRVVARDSEERHLTALNAVIEIR